jgi:tetraacyldisaccharide 4'-kinase
VIREDGPRVEDEALLYGWARRSLYGDGGPAGTAARAAGRPVGWAWSRLAGRRLRRRRPSARLTAPALGVGNVTVGGGGKTSLVGWLLDEGLPEGARAAVLSRGTGRIGSGVRVLRPGDDLAASRVGDEPALLAKGGAWVGVARDREKAAQAVTARRRPHVFILDDALQHRRVARALDLVVFTAEDLEAPARCLPAGPLRQGPGWRPALGTWIVVGKDPRSQDFGKGTIAHAFHGWWESLPGFIGSWRDAGTVELGGWRAGREIPFVAVGGVVAFAGVAKPESVERFARATGVPPRRIVAFPDHHRYRAADVRDLLEAHPGAALLTTEKDAVKLDPAWFGDRPVGVLRRRLQIEESGRLRDLVREAIGWPR